MIAALAGWPARHRALASVILIVLVLAGIVMATRLSIERMPRTAGTTLRVQAELPGLDAAQVERLVILPLEDRFASLPHVLETVSRSRDGLARLELRFDSTAAREAAFDDVRARLDRSVSDLPAGIDPLIVQRDDPPATPAAVYAITAPVLAADTVSWVEQALLRPLRELPEISSVVLEGAETSEVLLQPDAPRLATLGLSFDDLIQAIRRGEQAPRRRATSRAKLNLSPSIEAIAARAVRLPDGEPLPLAEVAQLSVVSRQAAPAPRYRGAPALWLRVYARTASQALTVAARSNAHIGWLRVNGLVQSGIEIHPVFDEARQTRAWLNDMLSVAAASLVAVLLAVYLFCGARAVLATVAALGPYLSALAAALSGMGFALNASSIAGAILGFAVLAALTYRSVSVVATAVCAALALAWFGAGPLQPSWQTLAAGLVAISIAVVVRWLITSWWRRSESMFESPAARLLRWRSLAPESVAGSRFKSIDTWTLTLSIAGIVALTLHALPAPATLGHALQWRTAGDDREQLERAAGELLSRLRVLPDLEEFASSSELQAHWRLDLDWQRLDELGIPAAEVGRAFAVAREGLLLGEAVDADARWWLRLQLAPGAAGGAFERLLLRGERDHRPAWYLRDVGVALQALEARERLRVQRMPAVEINARSRVQLTPSRLAQLRAAALPPQGARSPQLAWDFSIVGVATYDVAR